MSAKKTHLRGNRFAAKGRKNRVPWSCRLPPETIVEIKQIAKRHESEADAVIAAVERYGRKRRKPRMCWSCERKPVMRGRELCSDCYHNT